MAVNGIVACNDYDTHEADSVPRFGGRRASGELQRGPPRQKRTGHEEHEGRNEADYNFSSPGSLRSFPSIVLKLSHYLFSFPSVKPN